jgi:methyltransferase (TIGR00027 family)
MFRLPADPAALTVYEIDLPDMIAARETLLAEVADLPILRREVLGLNLELEDLPQRLLEETSFCPTQPTIALFEGVSMYLNAQVNHRILAALGSVLQHPESRLGLDLVAETVVSRNTDFAEARELIDGMRDLGEPFLFGISDPATYFASQGYEVLDQAPANCYRHEQPAALFDLYRFLIVRHVMHSDSPMAFDEMWRCWSVTFR